LKTKLIIILFLFAGISSCKKNKATIITYSDAGTLTGFDPRLCACCGGVFLYTDYANTYHIESLPGMSGQDFGNLTFPKRIKYNWSIDRNCSGTIYIKITSYKFE